jgi:hypothetical protein
MVLPLQLGNLALSLVLMRSPTYNECCGLIDDRLSTILVAQPHLVVTLVLSSSDPDWQHLAALFACCSFRNSIKIVFRKRIVNSVCTSRRMVMIRARWAFPLRKILLHLKLPRLRAKDMLLTSLLPKLPQRARIGLGNSLGLLSDCDMHDGPYSVLLLPRLLYSYS